MIQSLCLLNLVLLGSLSVVGSPERERELERPVDWSEAGASWPLMRRRPIPGSRHAIFPSWPGWRLLAEPEPAILPPASLARCGQESFTCGGAVAFLVPACRPTPSTYSLTFTGFGRAQVALKWTHTSKLDSNAMLN